MSYALPLIPAPVDQGQGLLNFVQMAINDLEAGDQREALLRLVDLRDALNSGIYDGATCGRKNRADGIVFVSTKRKRAPAA